jgi:rhodanese-related sulfurtransferase
MRKFGALGLLAALVLIGGCSGPESDLPDDYEGKVRVVDAGEYRAWRESGREFVILDVRTVSEFREGRRAPGAVAQPWSYDFQRPEVNDAFLADVTSRYPADETLLLLCSEGMRASQAAWTLQQQAGYTRAYVFAGGYEGHDTAGYPRGAGWKAAGLPLDE